MMNDDIAMEEEEEEEESRCRNSHLAITDNDNDNGDFRVVSLQFLFLLSRVPFSVQR